MQEHMKSLSAGFAIVAGIGVLFASIRSRQLPAELGSRAKKLKEAARLNLQRMRNNVADVVSVARGAIPLAYTSPQRRR
jgi:hypothetical protein